MKKNYFEFKEGYFPLRRSVYTAQPSHPFAALPNTKCKGEGERQERRNTDPMTLSNRKFEGLCFSRTGPKSLICGLEGNGHIRVRNSNLRLVQSNVGVAWFSTTNKQHHQ
jgi:hypothetical protein